MNKPTIDGDGASYYPGNATGDVGKATAYGTFPSTAAGVVAGTLINQGPRYFPGNIAGTPIKGQYQ